MPIAMVESLSIDDVLGILQAADNDDDAGDAGNQQGRGGRRPGAGRRRGRGGRAPPANAAPGRGQGRGRARAGLVEAYGEFSGRRESATLVSSVARTPWIARPRSSIAAGGLGTRTTIFRPILTS